MSPVLAKFDTGNDFKNNCAVAETDNSTQISCCYFLCFFDPKITNHYTCRRVGVGGWGGNPPSPAGVVIFDFWVEKTQKIAPRSASRIPWMFCLLDPTFKSHTRHA